jgi:hypothetical protein
MPARKPQRNYLPFFGPYNRDWSMDDQVQFQTWPSKQKKTPSLARLQQVRPTLAPSGTTDDLSGAFSDSSKATLPLQKNSEPTQAQGRGTAGRLWDWANTGLISGDTIIGATSGVTREEIERAMEEVDPDHPYRQAARTFALGAYKDLADLASDFTSPISLALAGLGGVAKSASAAKKLAQTGQKLNRAQQLAVRSAPAAKGVLSGAGAGFAGRGAYEVGRGRPLDTLVSTGKVLTGGQSDVSPDEARQTYANAAALSGGLGAAISPFEFARVRLQDLQKELPARQRISYSDHDNTRITMEEALRRSNSSDFRQGAIRDAEKGFATLGGRRINTRTSVSNWDTRPEHAATTDMWARRKVGDIGGAIIGKQHGQQAVLRFRQRFGGPDAEYRLVGLKDPVSALDVFETHGIEGARAEGPDVVFVGRKDTDGPIVRAAANELGADIKETSGRARLIRSEAYDSILKGHEEQRALLAEPPSWKTALLPAPLSVAGTSYAANNRRKTPVTRRPTRSAR